MRLATALIFLSAGIARVAIAAGPPETPKHPVTDAYHGVSVLDDYRWLEDFSSPAVKQWVAAENQYTRSILDHVSVRAQISQELTAAVKKRATTYGRVHAVAGKLFAIKTEATREQPSLIVFSSLANNAKEHTVLDPLKLDSKGAISMDFYVPSLDGRLVAVSLSKLGSESGDLHIFEVATGKELTADTISRVNNGTAGGSVAWNADATGLYYTRYPHAGERPAADLDFYQQIYFHKLGESSTKDRYELGRDFPRIAEIALEASRDGKSILATVANGDGGEFFHFIHPAGGAWRQLTQYSDQISKTRFGEDGALYLLSRKNAPMGKVLRLRAPVPSLDAATVVVPESSVAVEDFVATAEHMFVTDLAGGPSDIRIFTTKGKALGEVPLEGVVSVDDMALTDSRELLFRTQGFIQPSRWSTYSPISHKNVPVTVLSPPFPVSYADTEVVRDFAVSEDGTRVPVNIIRKKGSKLDGANPVLLYGYGGYGVSETPALNPFTRVLLDHGFVYVVANIRGGGEYGEKWHLAGNLTHKQNVFDDFYACGQYLVSHKYTTPARLAIMGGSNGGLLMGAALTQHPEMYRVVLAFVGIYDMLRVELSPNGAFNVTEFGTVKEQDQFKALFAYSPYHHVKDGTQYPASIFLTGDNDPRVDPANSRKMVARLQAAGQAKGPILLRTSSQAGHGIGSSLSERISQYTDAFSFLFDQLGVK